jgi:CRP-like cAMP-binding protein
MRHARTQTRKPPVVNVHAFLEQGLVAGRIVRARRGDTVFPQGDPCNSVFCNQKGGVALRVVSHRGKEAIVATRRSGDFLGDGALTVNDSLVSVVLHE